MAHQPQRPATRWLSHLPPLALFAALTLWVTWPVWPAPATRIEDLGDPLLNAWILSWDHFALFHQIGDFFQANVFWPHDSSLAYGEHMLTQAVLALPFRLFTSHPAAIHNLSVLQGLFLSAVGAYLLGLHYFRRIAPATVCAVAYGFAAYRVNQALHLQLIHGEFLPLMILAFERALSGGGRRWRWALALVSLGQWLTSWYWAVFTFWCVAPYMAARLWQERRALSARRLASVIIPLALAAAAALPMAWPYIHFKQGNVMFRPREASAPFSARPSDYLAASRRTLLYTPFIRTESGVERSLFPGLFVAGGLFAALALALKDASRRRTKKNNPQSAIPHSDNPQSAIHNPQSEHSAFPLGLWLILTLALLAFTFGPQATLHGGGRPVAIPLPLALLRWFPMADQMRVPARWMLPALLGLALLCAEAWRRLAAARWRAARPLAALATLLLLAETLTRPMAFGTVPRERPAVIDWLNRQPYPSPTLFIPFAYERVMLEAAWLRQPLLNGSNGYFPPMHIAVTLSLIQSFPNPYALGALRALGTRFVVINTAEATRPSPGWGPERLDPMLRALPPELHPTTMGHYLVLDLGAHETDLRRIWDSYQKLAQSFYQAYRSDAPAPPR